MLSDNGAEFKNKMFEQISKELGLEYKLYTPPYHPASNGRIEGFHAFLKVYIAKHVAPPLEWDVLIPLACAAYNFFYQTSIQKNLHSSLCLEEILSYLLIHY